MKKSRTISFWLVAPTAVFALHTLLVYAIPAYCYHKTGSGEAGLGIAVLLGIMDLLVTPLEYLIFETQESLPFSVSFYTPMVVLGGVLWFMNTVALQSAFLAKRRWVRILCVCYSSINLVLVLITAYLLCSVANA